MSEIFFIRLRTDTYDDRKMKIIDLLPNRDTIQNLFIKFICEAGQQNNGGYIYVDTSIGLPLEELLAAMFNRDVNVIRGVLQTLGKMGMLEIGENYIFLVNFAKNQNIEGMERIREQTRMRVAKFRAKEKTLPLPSPDMKRYSNVTVTHHKNNDNEKNNEKNNENESNVTCNVTDNGKPKEIDVSLWEKAKGLLKREFSAPNFKTYIQNTVGLGRRDGLFAIGVANTSVAEYLDTRHKERVARVLSEVSGEQLEPVFCVIQNLPEEKE